MWEGFRHGVHYIDHIKLLSTKVRDVTGGAYTVYPFKNEQHWSLSFDVKISGDMFTNGDGVFVGLTGQSLTKFGLNFGDPNFEIADEKFIDGISHVCLQDVLQRTLLVLHWR
jgi:hypothetical protein